MEHTKNRKQNRAIWLMFFVVILVSLEPLLVSIGDAKKAPFLFVGLWNWFCCIPCVVYLFGCHREKINDSTWRKVRENCFDKYIVWATAGALSFVLFPVALKFIDVAVATILVETWPLFLIFLLSWFDKEKEKYTKMTAKVWLLLAVALIGFGFIILSQVEGNKNISDYIFDIKVVLGVGAALLVAIGRALMPSCTLKWCNEQGADNTEADSKFFTVVAIVIAKLYAGAICFVAGLMLGENPDDIVIMLAIAWGLIGGVVSILLRFANIVTTNLGVNALIYASPIVALGWLAVFSQVHVPHIELLVIGTMALITANLLINFEADIRLAYRALMIALWACGAVVYLTGGYDYTGNVEIAATIFILILSFRVDRLVRRTADEENKMLLLFRQLALFVESKKIKPSALDNLLSIDTHKTRDDLKSAYINLKQHITDAKPGVMPSDEKELAEMEAEIDSLAHSKQQGVHFGEITAISFVGGIFIVALLFFTAPGLAGWDRFFTDISSFVLAAVTLFLIFNILDLENDRKNDVLKLDEKLKTYQIVFDDATNRSAQQWISLIVSVSIVITYAVLLWLKWCLPPAY